MSCGDRLSPRLGRRAAAVPVRSGTLERSRPNSIEGTPRHVELRLGLFAPLIASWDRSTAEHGAAGNVQKIPRIGRLFSGDRTGWLGWEDSNSQMSLPKLAFEVSVEFPFIWERLAIRDFSRLSCQRVICTPVHSAMNMARRSPRRCGQAMIEGRLLWIREFESSHPSQPILLRGTRLCSECQNSLLSGRTQDPSSGRAMASKDPVAEFTRRRQTFGIRLENTNPPHFFCDRNASSERRVRPISALLP